MKNKTFTITIKGQKWKYRLLPDDVYVNKYGSDSEAITLGSFHLVVFNVSHLSLVGVRHELVHMYSDSLYLQSANISQDDMEEIYAELFSRNWDAMDSQAKQMFEKLTNRRNALSGQT